MPIKKIVTHPGSAHKDDFLACSLLISLHDVPIERRLPSDRELTNPEVCLIDIGHEHKPELLNFDHHQFPRDHVPTCSLSLV
ncbi:MAG: MYG1 family protein, partial [Verrucomicrobiota bacterium]